MPNQWVIQKYGELQRVIDVATRNSKWKVLALDAPPWMVASWCFSEASLGERLRLATAWGLGSAPLYAKFSDVVIRTRSEFFARRIIDKAPANSRTVALVGSSHVDSLIDALGRGGQIQVNAHPTRSFFNTCLFNLVHMRGCIMVSNRGKSISKKQKGGKHDQRQKQGRDKNHKGAGKPHAKKPASAEDLDRQLAEYMGEDYKKKQLDLQLDAYRKAQ